MKYPTEFLIGLKFDSLIIQGQDEFKHNMKKMLKNQIQHSIEQHLICDSGEGNVEFKIYMSLIKTSTRKNYFFIQLNSLTTLITKINKLNRLQERYDFLTFAVQPQTIFQDLNSQFNADKINLTYHALIYISNIRSEESYFQDESSLEFSIDLYQHFTNHSDNSVPYSCILDISLSHVLFLLGGHENHRSAILTSMNEFFQNLAGISDQICGFVIESNQMAQIISFGPPIDPPHIHLKKEQLHQYGNKLIPYMTTEVKSEFIPFLPDIIRAIRPKQFLVSCSTVQELNFEKTKENLVIGYNTYDYCIFPSLSEDLLSE